jgi:flagellar protein FliO/FliZ
LIQLSRFSAIFSAIRRIGALGSLSAQLSAPAWAQAAAVEAPGVPATAMLQMLFGLALIVGVLFVGAFFLRKLNGGRSFGNSGPLRVVGGLMLSTRERIVLVEVGDTWIVVGIVPGQIRTLHTLPREELPVRKDSERPFGQWLKQMTERNNANK